MSEESSFFKLIFANFPEPLFVIDNDLKCVTFNEAFKRWLGSESVGETVSSFWPEAGKLPIGAVEVRAHFVFQARSDEDVNLIVTPISSEWRLVQLLPESGVGGEKHFQAQRLRTLGMLASGVAHDFNNVLAGIFGHVSYLKNILPENGPHIESLDAIEEGAMKASVISKQILQFSKLETSETLKKIDLKELVMKTFSLLRGALPPIIELKVEMPDEKVFCSAVEGRLAQVIVNLVINARDALEKAGEIVIRVLVCHDKERIESAKLDSKKNWLELAVQDNGKGMSEAVMQRIFEPYFSTKADKGTGLGLATVLAIVRSFGGGIQIKSQVGEGTCMSIFLPQIFDEIIENTVTQAKVIDHGRGTILIVEDEDAVRNVIRMSLTHLGYVVTVAASGVEAIKIVAERQEKFDLVLLDMLMPHLTGDETFFKLRELCPEIKVIAMSGFTSEESIKKILDNGGCGFIQKPFTIDELSKQIKTCLQNC